MLRYFRHSHILQVKPTPCLPQLRGRKSRTDPPAKSKALRIKYPPPVCVEELLNVKQRYHQYRTILAAVRAECKEEVLRTRYEDQVGSLAEQRHRQESEEHKALMDWNREQNRIALHRRLERLKQEGEAARLQHELSVQQRQVAMQEFIQKKKQEIDELQEISKTFITADNLSERIEAALDNPRNYNFCIDRDGRTLSAREP
ncbi:28S ribosomal S26, mitochondrial [Pelobates cultripes]|nr:28S ribosomal S26, mitochondrial [Pelobates cultripes]